ncbi:hypothetical protein BPAE_0457g00040 [Botrytis paeoniae]|uniref:Uncharacterized protein n=1 Tax=Botrytis paeoniae TaxID=278948 RepID=A0A4Z1EXA3_9HELO|nr:hypothetical protein BPAE_0457g00040 [Botrytis paeoniae]
MPLVAISPTNTRSTHNHTPNLPLSKTTQNSSCLLDVLPRLTTALYCLTHQYYCPVCAASPLKKGYVMLCASDSCTKACGYKHPDHKVNVKARQDAEKKAKEAAAKAKIEDGRAKVAAQKATAAVRSNGR